VRTLEKLFFSTVKAAPQKSPKQQKKRKLKKFVLCAGPKVHDVVSEGVESQPQRSAFIVEVNGVFGRKKFCVFFELVEKF
jgi:hypothetical protein